MTADIVNLKRMRKAKARAGKAGIAAVNRLASGRSKAEREMAAAQAARATGVLDGAMRAKVPRPADPPVTPAANGPACGKRS